MVKKNEEIVIKGITEQQLRKIIQEELDKFSLGVSEALVAAWGATRKS